MRFLALFSILALCASAHVSNLFPYPSSVKSGSQTVYVHPSQFAFVPEGAAASSHVVTKAVDRFQKLAFPRTPAAVESTKTVDVLKQVSLSVSDASEVLNHATDESYNITVTAEAAKISAETVFGLLRGMETFTQLMDYEFSSKGEPYFAIDSIPIQITDIPRFTFRGLMIDTSRHFLPLDLILDNLDVMAFNKLNVLHWHIVDSQSFPYQSEVYPELSQHGAYQADHVYTIADVKKVVDEAFLRGIRVIPEFDTPGHTQSWGNGMPDILSHCPNPSEPLDPSNEKTYEVLTNLYKEISTVFADEYVHLGGDEVSFDCWKQDPNIAALMKAQNLTDYAKVEQYFETKLLKIVGETLNKKTIVWQEIVNNGLSVRPDTVVDVWKGFDKETLLSVTEKGLQAIVSGPFYLDHLGDDWDTFYRFDITDFGGSDAQKALVIGGHSSMWGEHVDAANFMSRTWPRASAVAEKLWTTQEFSTGDAYPRIADFRCRMVARNIPADSLGPGYCPVEVEYQRISGPKASML